MDGREHLALTLYDGAKLKQDASVVVFALHHEVWLLQGHEQSHSICRLQVMAMAIVLHHLE